MCFTEHWLCNGEISCVDIDGYCLATGFYRGKGEHGGVLIMTKKNLLYQEIPEISLMSVILNCEVCGIRLRESGIVVVCVYRPPTGDMNVFYGVLSEIFDLLKITKNNFFIDWRF